MKENPRIFEAIKVVSLVFGVAATSAAAPGTFYKFD
jgi:hypothetical protein